MHSGPKSGAGKSFIESANSFPVFCLRGRIASQPRLLIPAHCPLNMNYFLFKTEPDVYSFDDFLRDQETVWDGVTNPTAVKNLREMKPGTKWIFYHTGDERTAVGTGTVVSGFVRPQGTCRPCKGGQASQKPKDARRHQSRAAVRRFAFGPNWPPVRGAADPGAVGLVCRLNPLPFVLRRNMVRFPCFLE